MIMRLPKGTLKNVNTTTKIKAKQSRACERENWCPFPCWAWVLNHAPRVSAERLLYITPLELKATFLHVGLWREALWQLLSQNRIRITVFIGLPRHHPYFTCLFHVKDSRKARIPIRWREEVWLPRQIPTGRHNPEEDLSCSSPAFQPHSCKAWLPSTQRVDLSLGTADYNGEGCLVS